MSGWIAQEIERYVASQRLDTALLLAPHLLNTLKTALPKDPRARTTVVGALLDWTSTVIDAALADASLRLRRAVRAGRVDVIHEILAVAAKTVELREGRVRLRAAQRPGGGRRPAAPAAERVTAAGRAGFDGAGGVALTPLEVAILANQLPSGDPSRSDDEGTRWPRGGIVPLKAPIVDARGAIQPVISVDVRSCEVMTTRAGAVRGNHYHRRDWHFCYVLSGSMEYVHRPAGSHDEPERLLVTAGQLVFTPPMVEHAMVFPEETTILMLRRISREQRDVVAADLVERPNRV
ncbi:MAG: cupin domain-containing protein [bacterium]